MKPYDLRLAKAKWNNDEVIFNKNKSFGIHAYFDNSVEMSMVDEREMIGSWALAMGYILLGAAKMVYVPQNQQEDAWL